MAAPDFGPLARYMDVSLRQVELRAQQHAAMVARIGSILSEKVDMAANEIVQTASTSVPSLLSEDDIMRLEANSLESRIALLDLQNDIVVLPENHGDAMGKFLPIVARNIALGRPYKFLLPNRPGVDWRDLVVRMRGLLRTQCSADAVNRYCEIRVTESPLFGGVAVYLLDESALRTTAPAFYEMIRPYVDANGCAGNAVPPHGSAYAAAMFDTLHLSNAIRQFDLLWRRGTII